MKYRLEYISTFYSDISQVIINLGEYPQKAKRLFAKLDKKLNGLTKMPEMYPVYEDFPVFRKITVEDYLVFYTVNVNDKLIEVHRLIYGRMDTLQQLFP